MAVGKAQAAQPTMIVVRVKSAMAMESAMPKRRADVIVRRARSADPMENVTPKVRTDVILRARQTSSAETTVNATPTRRADVIARRARSADPMEIVCPTKPAVSAWTTRVGRTLMDSIARITQKNHRDAIGHRRRSLIRACRRKKRAAHVVVAMEEATGAVRMIRIARTTRSAMRMASVSPRTRADVTAKRDGSATPTVNATPTRRADVTAKRDGFATTTENATLMLAGATSMTTVQKISIAVNPENVRTPATGAA